MSAYGYKRTFNPYLANVRFTPESGHWLLPLQHELDQPIVVGELHQIMLKVTATSFLDHLSATAGTEKCRQGTVDARLGAVSTRHCETWAWLLNQLHLRAPYMTGTASSGSKKIIQERGTFDMAALAEDHPPSFRRLWRTP